jgi:hypothetical protein
MGDTILASWLRAPWRWWRALGRQLHEDILTLCLFLTLGSAFLVPNRWGGLVGWVWGESGLGGTKEQLLTLGTMALAAATYGLFRRTADLAAETQVLARRTADAGLLADMHHQESLSGVMTVSDLYISDVPGPTMRGPDGPPSYRCTIVLAGTLRNVGFGPALKVTMSLIHQGVGYAAIERRGTFPPGKEEKLEGLREMATVTWAQRPLSFISEPMTENWGVDVLDDGLVLRVECVNIFGAPQVTTYTTIDGIFREDIRPMERVARALPHTLGADGDQ